MANIKYGKVTPIKSVAFNFVYGGTLTSRGDGSKTVGICINPTTSGKVLTVTDGAKIYTNEAGTLGEATTKVLTHTGIGSATTYYVKLSSGTAKWYVNTKQIDEFSTQQSSTGHENAPKIGGDFTNWVGIKTMAFVSRVNFPSNVTKVFSASLNRVVLSTAYNEGRVTGDISGAIHAVYVTLKDYADRIAPNLMHLTGDISLYDSNPWLELVDEYGTALDITADLTDVDPSLLYGDTSGFYGNGSLWTHCCYIEDAYSNVTFDTILGMTKLGYAQFRNKILTQAQVNQYPIDFLANIDVVKGYGPSEQVRTFDISGLPGTPAPSSAEAIAAIAAIRAWRGTSGQYVVVITR